MRINVGSIGWAGRPDQTGVISPDYVVFSCTDRIEAKLVYLFLRSAIGLRAINLETAGSVRERLYFDSLARIRFPLPPLPEQRQIVVRIEELSAKINEARRLRRCVTEEAGGMVSRVSSYFIDAAGWPNEQLPDQNRIVGELDAVQLRVDALKKLQSETTAEFDALLPSILDKAFRGEL